MSVILAKESSQGFCPREAPRRSVSAYARSRCAVDLTAASVMTQAISYFAYGTLKQGFPNRRGRMQDLMADPMGTYRTVDEYALIVPKEPVCANPNCNLMHYMAALVPGVSGFHVEGELFEVEADTLAAIDSLEIGDYGAAVYEQVAIELVSLDDDEHRSDVVTYQVRDPPAWIGLANRGLADIVERYGLEYAKDWTLKDCCVRNPDHHGAHDVFDPLAHAASAGD